MNRALVIRQGSSYLDVVRWETEPFIYKPITAISQSAPAVVTAVGHGLTNGWRAAIVSAKGMRQINATDITDLDQFHSVTVVDADNVSFNDINSSGYSAYTSGGYLQFYTPHDLSSYTARMQIKDKVGGNVLLSLTTENGGITIDPTAKTITRTISATDTAAITWTYGVYDMELVAPDGTVTNLNPDGPLPVIVQREVTT
jgi:hypothetical protein